MHIKEINIDAEIERKASDALMELENIREDFADMYEHLMRLTELVDVEENQLFYSLIQWFPSPDTLESLGDELAGMMYDSKMKAKVTA